jgi:pimeloyl-ACP methyl ester carboxylesterase
VFRAIALSALCLLACGCHRPPVRQATLARSARSHYERRTNAEGVVVFIHGVFGDAESTWTNAESGAFWPDLLSHDDAFNDSDIYVLAFDSPYLRTASTVDELVEQVHQDLVADEVFSTHKRVIFLCHSMGGLVTRKLLTRYQPLAEIVPLIYFFATPTEGADVTRIVRALSGNPQIANMSPAGADNYVTLVQRDWRAARFRTVSRCAYEEKPHGLQIVSQMSASQLCDGPVLPIPRDHIGIVKPLDRNDPSYVAFRTAYVEAGTPTASATANPPSSPRAVELTTAALVAKLVEVRCGATADQTIRMPFSSAQHPGQRMVDAIVSIQQASNLKYASAEVQDRTATDVIVRYRLAGLDPDAAGRCALGGQAALTLAFVLTGPAVAEPIAGAHMQISQTTHGDMSPAIAAVGGNVTFVHNAEPTPGGPSPSAMVTPAPPSASPLLLATNPSLQGLLLDQRTRGSLSPALAAIGGSILIQENTQQAPTRH